MSTTKHDRITGLSPFQRIEADEIWRLLTDDDRPRVVVKASTVLFADYQGLRAFEVATFQHLTNLATAKHRALTQRDRSIIAGSVVAAHSVKRKVLACRKAADSYAPPSITKHFEFLR